MIYRAPMRARDRETPGADHGLAQGLVGIGSAPDDAKARRMRDAFAALPEGVFVWTRASDGMYWLGRISGPYREDPDSPVGLHHVRPADWLDRPFGEDDVPAAVAATFARGGRNVQRIRDEAAERRTAELWG